MKVVLEHPDGRRLSAEDHQLGNPDANPFNRPRNVISWDTDHDLSQTVQAPGRLPADHISLLDEGFEVVGMIDFETGHERSI